MNVAIIIAGGTGNRMGQDIPKQFLHINDKPIIIYTMETFQRHPQVDAILCVCLDGWHEVLRAYSKQFYIDKLRWVISGGKTGQESIRNGVYFLAERLDKNDVVIIHDGIRPMVNADVLTDVIVKCEQYGNAVTSVPCNDQIFVASDEMSTKQYIKRETLRKVTTPQAYKMGRLKEAYDEAFKKRIGIDGSSYTNTMMVELGERLYFSRGSDKNIKLTTMEDVDIFKALLNTDYSSWQKENRRTLT